MIAAKKKYPDIPAWVKVDIKLAEFTEYNVGGIADFFAAPKNEDDLAELLKWSSGNEIPFFVLGSGSNVLIADEGFRGLIIWTRQCCSLLKRVNERTIKVGGSVLLHDMVLFAEQNSLKGVSHLAGIPGTVGGAVHMNAGAFSGEIGDVVRKIMLVSRIGIKKTIQAEEAGFGYRHAAGIEQDIVTGCEIELEVGEKEHLAEERKEILRRRSEKQPQDHPSCGSVFKRPPGDYAGRLIDIAGLRGEKRGGATVSEKHANFIVNTGDASAADIYELIMYVKEKVLEKTGVELETEVKIIGFEGRG